MDAQLIDDIIGTGEACNNVYKCGNSDVPLMGRL